MSTHRISRQRQRRKLLVGVFGRQHWRSLGRPRRSASTDVSPDSPRRYRRVSLEEMVRIQRWKARGWSFRKMARRLGRDHHTVILASDPARLVMKAMQTGELARAGAWLPLIADVRRREVLRSYVRAMRKVRTRFERDAAALLGQVAALYSDRRNDST